MRGMAIPIEERHWRCWWRDSNGQKLNRKFFMSCQIELQQMLPSIGSSNWGQDEIGGSRCEPTVTEGESFATRFRRTFDRSIVNAARRHASSLIAQIQRTVFGHFSFSSRIHNKVASTWSFEFTFFQSSAADRRIAVQKTCLLFFKVSNREFVPELATNSEAYLPKNRCHRDAPIQTLPLSLPSE